MHYLDATPQEETSTPLRFLIMFSFASLSSPDVQGMRFLGGGELNLALMKDLVKVRWFYICLLTHSLLHVAVA
jgi:exosome complex component RRP42